MMNTIQNDTENQYCDSEGGGGGDASNMNEGDSAGGGQYQGLNPASPAVPDRRSSIASTAAIQSNNSLIYSQQQNVAGLSNRSSSWSASFHPTSVSAGTSSATSSETHYHSPMSQRYIGQQHQHQTIYNLSNQGTIIATSSNNSTSSYIPPINSSAINSSSVDSINSTSENNLRTETTSTVATVVGNRTQSSNIYDLSLDLDPPSPKRIKIEDVNVNSVDLDTIKKVVSENRNLAFKRLKEIYYDRVEEMCFLQLGGNMMDYPVWKKKPKTQQFINFTKSYLLHGNGQSSDDFTEPKTSTQTSLVETVATTSSNNTNSCSIISNLPKGAEIKIPGVGATPVAVSTQLPAAVVQLTQQGHIPGRPQGGRHGMVFGQIPVQPTIGNSSVPLVPGGTPLVPDLPCGVGTTLGTEKRSTTTASISTPVSTTVANAPTFSPSSGTTSTQNGNSHEQFSVKAKQEVYVMQRVSELQREGLWTEKRLPKLHEPPRPKVHWDYVLEEMQWLAADFAQERKWKKAAAKKCARMVQKYFQDKAIAAQKAEKAQELQLKRIASFMAKEVKMFWSNVEKLVEYKQHTKLEEKRKKALDQHLSFIVDQTEKMTHQLAEGMNKTTVDSTAPSLNSSRKSSPKPKTFSDDEFRPENEASDDDEETIAKAEAEAADVNEEVAALQKESEMELDDFLKELPKDYLENRDKIVLSDHGESSSEAAGTDVDEEFKADEDSSDVEDTIMEQENQEKNVDHKKELDELNADNEMSVDELLAKYKSKKSTKYSKADEAMNIDSDEIDSDDDEEMPSEAGNLSSETDLNASSDDDEEDEEEEDTDIETSEAEGDSNVGLESLLPAENKDSKSDKDDLINDAAALAESIQPKGNTLSSTEVVTPVPFLLRHTLREYQHIGLDWLVTMHDRKLNGILADEMGLGKTIQTIALLAHLACVKGNWGPHLIIVPSSVMLNWEMECKKWCPGFKILTYYGTQKERKAKRIGWTKPNAFHICITSYKLVIQDQQSFRRKKWKYLILDEAQNIKNFKSQRWQLLLNFQTEQRLLLTGTPLQNNLMELWSLMHFLMPHVFQSHREFKEWFSNPMTGMIEGNSEYNDSIIKRLHKVLRPFLLRRLKSEVEKQMPKKYEHVVMCRLSKRQRYLYDDFMSRANTRETLANGNLLSVISVLMQLRKVCNHPNMFEERPTISPFHMERITYQTASLVYNMFNYDPFTQIDLQSMNLIFIQLELCLTAFISYRVRSLATPRKLIEEIDSMPDPSPPCPVPNLKFYVRVRDSRIPEKVISQNTSGLVKAGTSPAMKTDGNKLVPVINKNKKIAAATHIMTSTSDRMDLQVTKLPTILKPSGSNAVLSLTPTTPTTVVAGNQLVRKRDQLGRLVTPQLTHVLQTSTGRHILFAPAIGSGNTIITQSGHKFTVVNKTLPTRGFLPKVKLTVPPTTNSEGKQMLIDDLLESKSENQPSTSFKRARISLENEEVVFADREKLKKEQRNNRLQLMAKLNQKRCEAYPLYGADLCNAMLTFLDSSSINYSTWFSRSYTNCLKASKRSGYDWSLCQTLHTYEERTAEMSEIFKNFILFVPAVSAPEIDLHVSHPNPSKINEERRLEVEMRTELSPKLTLLHPIISAMSTKFPDRRLIQYDCGKLQTLDKLLRDLKCGGHRVLLFTQMTKMLDILEAFLNYHGYIYLRLDGTTKIEQRQILMERFNGDKRVFAFILSTRSGGVGVNLTGADTVIFYDSDWNPTMDAQAQDRCHRIGQTRDVHIYRLVSEKTIEENILKKANQKRLLGDLAIEGGNFTTAYFKGSTIQDLFRVETEEDAATRLSEVLERDRERKQRLQDNLQAASTSIAVTTSISTSVTAVSSTAAAISSSMVICAEEKSTLGAFESALAAAEDEQDVQAAQTATAEAAADLAEFDENIPLEDVDKVEISKAEQEVENLMKQLSAIERYAMRFVEETGGEWTADQLRVAEAEIEQQKREWEANRLAALQKEEEQRRLEEEEDDMLTYSREDSKQVWISSKTMEEMPIWGPPTPPTDDNDLYVDFSLLFLYEADVMSESELPSVYVKKDYKRSRTEAGFLNEGRRPLKIRREDNYYAPRSLFDRPSPAIAKFRRDLKSQRHRGIFKPNVQIPGLKPPIPLKPLVEPEGMTEWCIYEDIAILHTLQNLQGLPLNLMLLSPGHTPNWDLVAEIVNLNSRTYRSPKQCRYRYEAVIVPREEGKLLESPKKQKKMKNTMKTSIVRGCIKILRSAQLFTVDNNLSFTRLMKQKFENIKTAYLKKAPPPKQIFGVPSQKNSKHFAVLQEFGITNYDNPLSPSEIASRKAEKLKEKQRAFMPPSSLENARTSGQNQPTQQSIQQIVSGQEQQQIQQSPQQPTATIVVQQQLPVGAVLQHQQHQQITVQQQQQLQQVAQMLPGSPAQNVRQQLQQTTMSVHPQQATQIVKAIVTPSAGGIVTGQVQHLTQQHQLQSQHTVQTSYAPSSVSVVLTTPVSTLSAMQHQQQSSMPTQAQIVSIHQQGISSTGTLVTQTPTLVQSIATQSMSQVVSVSQLATVGTVLTTSAGLPTNATVATLNTSGLRAQRLVVAPGTLQEVLLQQRPTNQSPTIVSMSGLSGVTQSQIQAARLSMAGGQQLSNVVTKGISVGPLQQTGKPGQQQAQIQLYRQQPMRQGLKVLQSSQAQGGTAVVQTVSGQTTLVNAAGTIIQGGIVTNNPTVQVQGQKVSVSAVNPVNVAAGNPGVVTSVSAVQVGPQGRTQFIKQVGVGGKQTLTRQVTDGEMLLVKRQLIGQHKTQVIPQTQIFTPTNVQVQQAGTSGQQQIATLVKTSGGSVTSTQGTLGMTLSQLKPGQIKVTMPNQTQVRQLQIQPPIGLAQQRKPTKMTQLGQVAGKSVVPTQLIVQNPKAMPSSVTLQQFQQVIRQGQPATLATTGQIVLGKTSVGRVIPVSMASQQANRQTIQRNFFIGTPKSPQVVSAASAQALAAGNLRTHVSNTQSIAGTIKVAGGGTQVQNQQALINVLQQTQQSQRQNASPVRLQNTSGSLVAVAVPQQQMTQGNVVSTSTSTSTDVGTITQQQQSQQQQQSSQQQVRTLVKKKIMSFKTDSSKEQ